MTQRATKLVIITEKLLLRHIADIIHANGASGYTVTPADGQGSRNLRSSGQPKVSDTFANIKIEVITMDEGTARKISEDVAKAYFDNFSGLTYIDDVEVLYAHSV
jgi:nitrogen regulatory protein PII